MRARLVLAYGSMSARPHTRARLPIASQLHNITQARARAPSAAPPPTTAGSGDQLALASSSLLACIRALPGPHASYQRRQEWLWCTAPLPERAQGRASGEGLIDRRQPSGATSCAACRAAHPSHRGGTHGPSCSDAHL